MNNEEFVAWGRAENEARKKDLANLASPDDLERAKKAAKARRRAANLTAGQAARAVKAAQMEDR